MFGGYFVWVGCLVYAVGIFVLFFGFGLVGYVVGFVNGSYVVVERNGFYGFVYAVVYGSSDFGGERGVFLSRGVLGLL